MNRKSQPKKQKLDGDGVITYITNPDNTINVKIVSPEEFSKYEFDKGQIDYCSVIGGNIFISSKAKYDHVIVHTVPYNGIYPIHPTCIASNKK